MPGVQLSAIQGPGENHERGCHHKNDDDQIHRHELLPPNAAGMLLREVDRGFDPDQIERG
jgi:hypothetical protein